MRLWGPVLAALSVVVLAGEPASAQQRQRQGPGGFGGPAALLQNPAVQKELKLTEEQLQKARELAQGLIQKFGEELRGLRELQAEERAKKFQELSKKISEETNKALKDILKPDQLKRLSQIVLQQRGMEAFADETVHKALKLTEDQLAKAKEVVGKAREEMRDLYQNPRENREKLQALRKSTLDKLHGLLTEDQKKAWKELTGEPFQFEQFRPGGPGAGGERRRPRGGDSKPGDKKPAEKKPSF